METERLHRYGKQATTGGYRGRRRTRWCLGTPLEVWVQLPDNAPLHEGVLLAHSTRELGELLQAQETPAPYYRTNRDSSLGLCTYPWDVLDPGLMHTDDPDDIAEEAARHGSELLLSLDSFEDVHGLRAALAARGLVATLAQKRPDLWLVQPDSRKATRLLRRKARESVTPTLAFPVTVRALRRCWDSLQIAVKGQACHNVILGIRDARYCRTAGELVQLVLDLFEFYDQLVGKGKHRKLDVYRGLVVKLFPFRKRKYGAGHRKLLMEWWQTQVRWLPPKERRIVQKERAALAAKQYVAPATESESHV